MTTTRARRQCISRLCSKKELTYLLSQLRAVVIAGIRASVQPYSEGEASPFLSLCVQEPGSLSRINTTWSRQGLHSKAALLPRARSLLHVNSLLYVRTHARITCCVLRVHTRKCNTSQWVFPVQRMSIYGVAKEVFEIKRRSRRSFPLYAPDNIDRLSP